MDLIKQTTKRLNLTYKELGEKIGYSESAIKASIAKNEISLQMETAIKMLLEIESLKAELKEYADLKNSLKKALK